MRIFILFSVLFSLLPVMALNLSPKAGEDVLAIFGEDFVLDDVETEARRLGLNVVSFNPEFRHLIVNDQTGNTSRALYSLGADYVLDASYAQMCQPPSGNN